MHPRFHFDLENDGEAVRDEEGVLALDLASVLQHVVSGLTEMRDSGELDEVGQGWFLVVRDAEGIERQRLPL